VGDLGVEGEAFFQDRRQPGRGRLLVQTQGEPRGPELRIDLAFREIHPEEPADLLVEPDAGLHGLDLEASAPENLVSRNGRLGTPHLLTIDEVTFDLALELDLRPGDRLSDRPNAHVPPGKAARLHPALRCKERMLLRDQHRGQPVNLDSKHGGLAPHRCGDTTVPPLVREDQVSNDDFLDGLRPFCRADRGPGREARAELLQFQPRVHERRRVRQELEVRDHPVEHLRPLRDLVLRRAVQPVCLGEVPSDPPEQLAGGLNHLPALVLLQVPLLEHPEGVLRELGLGLTGDEIDVGLHS